MKVSHSIPFTTKIFPVLFMMAVMATTNGQSTDSTDIADVSDVSDSTEHVSFFGGSATLTNNGISLLPTFSLGKPAAIFDMKVGRKLTFEPQFRFALNGKPWSFIFWFRYKFLSDRKFQIRVGAHPAILFSTRPVTYNGTTGDMLTAQRYVAMEIAPDYHITKKISIGAYFLKAHGFQDYAVMNSDFITINLKLTDINLSKNVSIYLIPQFYYLKMDDMDGFYFSSTQGLTIKNFPLSIQSIINQPIQSDITGGQEFVWNVSLIYAFGNQYRPIK